MDKTEALLRFALWLLRLLGAKPKYEGTNPCCVIGCEQEAEWLIENRPYGPDDFTCGCTAHVGELLCDATEHRIVALADLTCVEEGQGE